MGTKLCVINIAAGYDRGGLEKKFAVETLFRRVFWSDSRVLLQETTNYFSNALKITKHA